MTARQLGIDVGGTKCLGVVIDADGALLAETPSSRRLAVATR